MSCRWSLIAAIALVALLGVGSAAAADAPASGAEQGGAEALPTSSWEIQFDDGIRPVEYARQLDFFKIELAAVSKNGDVEYAWHLAQPRPDTRVGKMLDESRMNNYWKRGNLVIAEGRLLAKAGISTQDKTMTHFYPREVELHLAELEKKYAGRDSRAIARTRFKIRPVADAPGTYEFFVAEQDVLPPASGSQNAPAKGSK